MKKEKNKAYLALKRITRRLRVVAGDMEKLGREMEYLGGFGPMAQHGREMQGAANLAESWVKRIESEDEIYRHLTIKLNSPNVEN